MTQGLLNGSGSRELALRREEGFIHRAISELVEYDAAEFFFMERFLLPGFRAASRRHRFCEYR
jgi:hypothetical protein